MLAEMLFFLGEGAVLNFSSCHGDNERGAMTIKGNLVMGVAGGARQHGID